MRREQIRQRLRRLGKSSDEIREAYNANGNSSNGRAVSSLSQRRPHPRATLQTEVGKAKNGGGNRVAPSNAHCITPVEDDKASADDAGSGDDGKRPQSTRAPRG